MGQESERGKHELVVSMKHRNWLFSEMEERVAISGWKSRCAFSGLVAHCAVPEVAHHCLAGIRRRHVASVKRVRAAQVASPDLLSDPEVIRLEEAYRVVRKQRQSITSAS
jgi:hypothetical protein